MASFFNHIASEVLFHTTPLWLEGPWGRRVPVELVGRSTNGSFKASRIGAKCVLITHDPFPITSTMIIWDI
jgi:hypothetical protein